MSSPSWAHIATAVIVTCAHCCLTAADHCYVLLGTIEFVDKSVNDHSTHRLDHCDVVALWSEAQHAAQWSWTPNWVWVIHSSSFGIKHKPTSGLNSWRHIHHQIQQVSLCPSFSTNRASIYSITEGVTMLTGFPRTRWPWRRFSENYAARISVKI